MTKLLLPVRLTHEEVESWIRSIQPVLQQAKENGRAIKVDASSLKQFDSAALAALLAVRREAESNGLGFGVLGMSATLQSLADSYGIDALFAVIK